MPEARATGPPVLRPHKRQRRLPMRRVWASETRYIEFKAQQRRDQELAYAQLELDAIRQRRSDQVLDLLGNLVAASLCAEWANVLSLPVELPARAEDFNWNCKHDQLRKTRG